MSTKIVIMGFFLCAVLLNAEQSQSGKKVHDISKDRSRELDLTERPVYLLKVKYPHLKDKEKITDGKLLPERIYVRYEPRFFEIDSATNARKVTGALGLDVTNKRSKFKEEPYRRLLGVGSVVPGSWLGDDTPNRNYEFTGGDGPFATQFKPTEKPQEYRYILFYSNGECREATVHPNGSILDSNKRG